MDRVSELPDFVLQHIQSFLSTKQAAQTSVLSKAWQRAWSTRPTLDFDQSYFCRALQPLESRDNFLGFAGRTLQRYLVENLRIERFRLSVIMVDGSMLSFVEECIGTSVKSGVEELDLSFMALGLFYTVPQRIFTAKSLKVLKVRGDMSQPVEVRSDHVINLCYLKVLSLDYVYVDDRTIQNFISGCPLVENLILRNCEGLKEIKVDDKVNCLKEFRIESMYELEQVDIEAPRLELLRYLDCSRQFVPCSLNIDASRCQFLERLDLDGSAVTSNMFLESLVSKLPRLVSLSLSYCDLLVSANLLSPSLKVIQIYYCEKLLDIKINAPKLLSVTYHGKAMPSFYFSITTSSQLGIFALISCTDRLGTAWFLMLRKFLANLNKFHVFFTLSLQAENNSFNVEDLKGIPVPPTHEVENFKLFVSSTWLVYPALLDGLFWSCFPRNFSIHWSFKFDASKFISFILENLLVGNRNSTYCSSHRFKCWHHYLDKVEIESFMTSYLSQSLGSQTLAELMATHPRNVRGIDFRFTWKTEHTAEEDGGVEEGLIIKQSDRKDQESESEAVKTSNEEDIHESGASIFGRVAEEGDKKNGSSIIKALVTYVKQGAFLAKQLVVCCFGKSHASINPENQN